jgi:exopolysaccharide production protein ExoQ
MSARIATIAYMLMIVALFVADRDRKVRVSAALWLPVVWLAICGSRPVSMWFGMNSVSDSPSQYLEGSPFDRFLLAALVAAGMAVLIARRVKVLAILRVNAPIILFVVYCGISITWSDFPDVSLKRWVKLLGAVTMVLIVLTEANPLAAVKQWLARVGFLLVSVSVLFIKYYPDFGRGYNRFTWTSFYIGVATGKNELGIICLVFGIAAVWRLLRMYREGRQARANGPLIAQIAALIMIVWLFSMANSMTSQSCFLMAALLMASTHLRFVARHRWIIHVLVVLMLGVAISALFLNVGSGLLTTMGRNATLTGRTDVWAAVLSLSGSSWFGTGFESFWLGPRIERMWDIFWWHPNEAHNGYLEVYLNLGWVGVSLLAVVLVTGYHRAISAVRRSPEEGCLRLAFMFTVLAYNCTESAIAAMHPVWIVLLLATITVPGGWARRSARQVNLPVAAIGSPKEDPVAVMEGV